METVTSRDGTPIAFDRIGAGPAVIVVDGALCYRASGPSAPVARRLAERFTVYTYDRRGRGDSGDAAQPYSIDREVEDLAALINLAGGAAFLFGASSGAVLALEAASRGVGVAKLALYEAPFIVDDGHPPLAPDFLDRLTEAVRSNRRGDAVKMFLRLVGLPAVAVAVMRFLPVWSKLTAVAHTLPYDISVVGPYQQGRALPTGSWSGATMATLAIDGGKSPGWIRNGMRSLVGILPNASYRTLPGQTHMINAKAVVPELAAFFAGSP